MLSNASSWTQLILTSLEIAALIFAGFKYINRLTSKLEKLDEIDARIKKVESQYVPNGGSSMRDAVNRIEKNMDKLQERFDNHIDNNNR
jgi:Tfp pilus assembly protein PilO